MTDTETRALRAIAFEKHTENKMLRSIAYEMRTRNLIEAWRLRAGVVPTSESREKHYAVLGNMSEVVNARLGFGDSND